VLGNSLFVLGLAALVGGLRHGSLTFSAATNRLYATLLILGVAALIVPFLAVQPGAPDFGHAQELSAVVAIVLAILFPGSEPKTWLRVARAMDQATSWVLCAVFGFIAMFSSYFGIPWRHRVFGIGLGFLFYLSVDVAVTTIVAHYGQTVFGAVWWVDMVAFLLACVIWGCYFGTPEAPRRVATMDDFRRIQGALRRAAPVIERSDLN
jgi:hypothetical protein